jgi:S1-C subfamily serine protease
MMKRTVVLCLLSAAAGMVVALSWKDLPTAATPSVAQGLARPAASPPVALPQTGPGAYPPNVAPANADDELTPEERINVAVYEMANRSVVNITTESVRRDLFLAEIRSEGEGSGIVLDKQGHILTNNHVVEGAEVVQVTVFTANSYQGKVVGIDPTTDVAILKIDAPAEDLFPVTFGDSSRLRVGQRVYAIGNPFGLERTLSTGIVASLDRTLPNRRLNRLFKQLIQIDAAINPGNSGGPLLDSHGRMIGMNMAIASKTGESAGVGFALPVNTAARVIPQLIQNGRVRRPDIGILTAALTDRGLLIAKLAPGGAAEKAGLRGEVVRQKRQGLIVFEYVDRSQADLIVAVDGQKVASKEDFLSAIESKQPGEQVTVSVIRQGAKVDVPVRLELGE